MRISSTDVRSTISRAVSVNNRNIEKALTQLATGRRINRAGDDSAGLAISQQLDSLAKSYKAAHSNAESAQSYTEIAESGLNEQSSILVRLRELAVQAASSQYSDRERKLIQVESEQLKEEFDRIAKVTKFGSQPILDGTQQRYDFQVGVHNSSDSRISINESFNTTASALDVDNIDLSDASDARDSLQTIDEASFEVMQKRAQLGALASRLDSTQNFLQDQTAGTEKAYGQITDAKLDESVLKARRGQILAQYQVAALNAESDREASLLRLVA